MNPTRGGWVILASLLMGMLASVVHLPETWPNWLGWLRPSWMMLIVFFWVMELPHRIGLISAWIIGVLLDALLGEPLGLNGFILASVTYITWRFFERLRMFSVVQHCVILFFMVLAAEILRGLAISLGSERSLEWGVLLIALSSVLVWPPLYLVLLRVKTGVRVE